MTTDLFGQMSAENHHLETERLERLLSILAGLEKDQFGDDDSAVALRGHIAALENDIAALRAERDELKATCDRQLATCDRQSWNLGGIDSIALGWTKPTDPIDKSYMLPAMESVLKLAAERDALREAQWIPTTERLPDMDGTRYETWRKGYSKDSDNGFDVDTAQGQAAWYGHLQVGERKPMGFGITHFRLPAPPKEQK